MKNSNKLIAGLQLIYLAATGLRRQNQTLSGKVYSPLCDCDCLAVAIPIIIPKGFTVFTGHRVSQ